MTITSSVRKAGPFIGNGAMVSFPFSFKVFSPSELLVVQAASVNGAEVVLVLGANYTATLNADQNTSPGGFITTPSALPVGQTLAITSQLEPRQPMDLTNLGGFYPKVINDMADRNVILIQQLTEKASRTLQFPLTGSAGGISSIPGVRAGSFLAFDAAGNPVAASGTGADGALRTDLASGVGGGNLIAFGPPGSLPRTVQGRILDIVSVKDKAAMDGLTDDTAAIQSIHDAFGPNGGALFFPSGVTVIRSLNISKQCLIYGSGAFSGGTYILAKDATSDLFVLQNSSIYIRDMFFGSNIARTDGSYILCTATSSIITVENCYMLGWYYGIRILSPGGPFYIRNVTMKQGVPNSGQAVRIENGTDVTCDFLVVDNAPGSPCYGGVVISACADVSLINCQLQHCRYALSIEPGLNQIVTSVYALNSFFDNSAIHGVRITPLSNTGCAITRVRLLGCWASSSAGSGVFIDNSAFPGGGISGIEIASLEAYINVNGVSINVMGAGNGNIDILGGKFSANSNNGITVFNVNNGLKIVGAKVGPNGALGGNGAYGIQINSGTLNGMLIASNDLTGNGAGPYFNTSTGVNRRVCDNLGYNGATSPSAITVGASPFTYTAGDTPETIYINGGTVGLVSIEGVNAFQQSNCTVKLNPGKAVVITYTATPGMIKLIE